MEREPILCYVSECWAYFTTQPLEKQHGDDWNNPYGGREPLQARPWLGESWEILKVAWDGPFETPYSYAHIYGHYSVYQINAGAVPWLKTDHCSAHMLPHVEIMAGTPFEEFCRLVYSIGGQVWVPMLGVGK